MGAEAVEYVRGIPVVKVFQQTVFSFKRFYDSIISYRDLVIKCTLVWRTPMSFYILAINAFAFFLVPTAIILIGHGGDTTTIIAHIAPLSQHDEPKRAEGYDIRLDDVSFRYEGAEKDAVSHINLTIPEGKTVALVGASGSGKTTIARLIPRFWDVCHGSVTIGGVDVRNMRKEELMRNVSFVFQNTRLFKTSLIENLRYGNPGATTDQINRAIDLSQSREIIDRLPQGVDTIIGAEGTYLSGGEQQRIVLARAILKDAPIVVLDEATAFADPENEQLIRKALAHLTQGKTVLMIAHRLTTVQDADSIVVVNNGEIVEQGTHEELLSKEKYYHRMWNEYQQSVSWKL